MVRAHACLPFGRGDECMLNALSDMLEVRARLGSGEGRVAVVASRRWYRSSYWLYDNPQRLASDVLEAGRAGVPWRSWVRVHTTG